MAIKKTEDGKIIYDDESDLLDLLRNIEGFENIELKRNSELLHLIPEFQVVHLLDIDDCILKSNFPNLSLEDQDVQKIVENVNEMGLKTKLYPEFLNFAQRNFDRFSRLFFITGRKRSHFEDLTKFQLKDLANLGLNMEIIYYPEALKHTPSSYNGFKALVINEIIEKYGLAERIYIYDDITDYFDKINKKPNVSLHEINKKDVWNNLNIKKGV